MSRLQGLWRWPDVFCEFELKGHSFEIWEPYGDSSRFHIAAKPLASSDALDEVHFIGYAC